MNDEETLLVETDAARVNRENEEALLARANALKVRRKKRKAVLVGAAALILVFFVIIAVIFGYVAGKPTAKAGSVYDGSSILNSYYAAAASTPKDLSDMYGLNTGDAESLVNDKPAWKAYSYEIEVKNKTKEAIALLAFETKNNGKDGIWLQMTPDDKIKIIGGNTQTILVTALVKGRDVSAETAMQEIKKFNIKIVYSKNPTVSADGKQSIETTKKIHVK